MAVFKKRPLSQWSGLDWDIAAHICVWKWIAAALQSYSGMFWVMSGVYIYYINTYIVYVYMRII